MPHRIADLQKDKSRDSIRDVILVSGVAKMPPSEPAEAGVCFVIGPIGNAGSDVRKHADMLLYGIIKYVLESAEFCYRVKRADEDADPGVISDRMIADILHSNLVIADLTDLNPNAFYELGIRHATQKPIIHIARSGTILPFDNAGQRTIFIDVTDWKGIEEARERLAASARLIKDPSFKISNPITRANAAFKMRESADPQDKLILEMQERVARIEARTERASARKSLIGPSERLMKEINEDKYARINIDCSDMISDKNSFFTTPYTRSASFQSLLDTIYFYLHSHNVSIDPYTYEAQWILLDPRSNKITSDNSDAVLLSALGIKAGDTLRAVRIS